jgi:hypothetical protein
MQLRADRRHLKLDAIKYQATIRQLKRDLASVGNGIKRKPKKKTKKKHKCDHASKLAAVESEPKAAKKRLKELEI